MSGGIGFKTWLRFNQISKFKIQETNSTNSINIIAVINFVHVAVADFFHAPDIDEIDVTNYRGAVGDTIRIRATDDFKVKQVHVTISNADGSLVEQGDAVQQANEIDWLYTATTANESTAGDRIVIRASDKPGNITEEEKAL